VRQIVLATRNGYKISELRTILGDLIGELDLEIVGMGEFPDIPDVVETGVTFAENATLKAVAAAQATGLPALADDYGPVRGRPGRCAGGVQCPLGRHPRAGSGQPRAAAGPALRRP